MIDIKADLHRVLFASLIIPVLLFIIALPASVSASGIADYTISDTVNGGECTAIGVWDAGSKTCTLISDVTATNAAAIEIASDNITLDGDFHTLTGSGSGVDIGVYLIGRIGVTVRNLNTDNFGYGIYMDGSSGNTLSGNTASGSQLLAYSLNNASNGNQVTDNSLLNNPGDAARIVSSSGNNFIGNTFANSGGYGVVVSSSDNNVFYGNDISNNNLDGIKVETSSGTEMASNSITGQTAGNGVLLSGADNGKLIGNIIAVNGTGLSLSGSSGNDIHNNDFVSNITAQAAVSGGSGNGFTASLPFGGNYWDDFDTPVEGCDDGDGDGFCDAPYIFSGGQDTLAWTAYDGWVDTTAPVVSSVLPDGTIYSSATTISVDYSDSGLGVDPSAVSVTLDGVLLVSGCTVSATNASCDVSGLGDGAHTIGGSVADYSGNSVPINGGFTVKTCSEPPQMSLSPVNVYWYSLAEYWASVLTVDFSLSSTTPDLGDITLNGATATHGVTTYSLPPSPIGQNFSVKYQIPFGVTRFSTTLYITVLDACGNSYDFPGPWTGE